MGAYILSKLIDTVCNAFKLLPFEVDVYYCVDSFTTLCWIKNHRPWKQYVQHRVDVIRKLTDIEKWRFCPGNMNPADIPSRGCSGKDLVESELWWSGPTFLREPSNLRPETPCTSAPNTTSEELVKHTAAITHSLATAALNRTLNENLEEIMDIERYGSKLRLLRITVYVLKFIRLLRGDRGAVKSKELKAEDLNFAEVTWVRGVQAHSFATERQDLLHGYERSKHVKQFNLYLNEDKIIRCKGRINNADTTEESKNPILLPSRHRYTELLIRERHDHVHHNGVRETLNVIRETHWVLKGKDALKRVTRKCTICRRYEGKPFTTPLFLDLPTDRVYEGPPFTYTGIDFAGSLYVNSASPENRSKAYCCLFTCASTRAVHLELTDSLTVTSFLQAFRRFVSRRGLPAKLLTDNAKTFKSVSVDVKKISRSSEVKQYLAKRQVDWQFIMERAPWLGGFWERLVRSVKRCLKKSVGRSLLTF